MNFKDSISHIQTAKNSNVVVIGLLNGDIFSFKYKVTKDEEEPLFSIEELAKIETDKIEDKRRKRREIAKSLSPFDPCYYLA